LGLTGGARFGLPAHAAPHGEDLDDETCETTDARSAFTAAGVLLALWLLPVLALVIAFGGQDVYARIAVFFSKMAVVTFGGAYAVLSYVAQQAVERFHWLTPGEMLDGLGMAETTPGPLIMVLQFVGFMAAYRDPGALPPLVAGALGGLLATYVTFAPCFLWIFAGAPYVETLRENKALSGALSAIAAAIVGVIANLTLWFVTHFLFRAHWTAAPLPAQFPDLWTIDAKALALSILAGALLRFGVGPALIASVGAGLVISFL
jgi:chromate transporter